MICPLAFEDLFVILIAVVVWAGIIRALWRYDLLERLVIPTEAMDN
ncbi:MAG: hypothetical protein JW966_09080 [Anaerolineae bacterium]|nr:hypothetical protein [Anaerolineae bacterium]